MKWIKEIGIKQDNFKDCFNVEYRINSLKLLKQNILKHEQDMMEALKHDLNKSKKEAFLCEINEVIEEIDYFIKHTKKFSKTKKVKKTYQVMGTKSYIYQKPKNKVLIIGPFNYPINLSLIPLIGAIAAGNKVLLKMSPLTTESNKIITKIINETFKQEHVAVLEQELKNYDDLYEYKPNLIFFTGSTHVGKIIEKNCVERNIEYVTEMGGECPCIVYDINTPAIYDRIIWAKFLNAGQTCVSINYILYNENITNFIPGLVNAVTKQFPNSLVKKNIPKVINKASFDRMVKIINENEKNILLGGKYDEKTLIIEPTIISVDKKSLHKYGEIFGPILLVCKMGNNIDEYIKTVNEIDDSPLASYFYASNKQMCEHLLNNINAGGYCFNDSLIHITNHNLPFGGVYTSGSGRYHGKYSFDTFSYSKPTVANFSHKNNDIKFINNDIDYNKTKKLIKWAKIFSK